MPQVVTADDPLLTIGEAAKALRISGRTVYRYVATGELASVRVSDLGFIRIRRSEIERLLAKGRTES